MKEGQGKVKEGKGRKEGRKEGRESGDEGRKEERYLEFGSSIRQVA